MKVERTVVLCLLLCSICLFSACGGAVKEVPRDSAAVPAANSSNLTFYDDVKTFCGAEQKAGLEEESFFVPPLPAEEYRLLHVSKRDGVYIALSYEVKDPSRVKSNLVGYDKERCGTLICQTYLFEDGNATLESFLRNGHREVSVDGKTYYLWEEHAGGRSEADLIGYEIVFLRKGRLVFMHLPAIDSFENMMRYADPEEVSVGRSES